MIEIVDPGLNVVEVAGLRAAAATIARRVADLEAGHAPHDDDAETPVLRSRGLAFESRVRTAARRALACQGRLDQLETVVACALRRRPA